MSKNIFRYSPVSVILVLAALVAIGLFFVIRRQSVYMPLTVRSNGIELWTESFGDKSKPAVLLVAGAMSPARFWTDDFCERIAAAGYFVIRYDHRDMGLSSAIDYARNPYTLRDLAGDAIAILDAYGIKKAHVVGHSMGGAIAQLLALDYPDRVVSVVPISSAVVGKVTLTDEEQKMLEDIWRVMGANKPTKKYEESVGGFLRVFEHLHGDIPMEHEAARAYIRDMYERSKPEHIAWFERFSAGTDPWHNHVKAMQNMPDRTEDLKKLQVPLFAIQGDKDLLAFPRTVQDYCVALVPGAKMHIIPGMGHEVFNRVLFAQIADLIIAHLCAQKGMS